MKKQLCKLVAVVAIALMTTGCASLGPVGFVYTDVTTPAAVTSNTVGTKVGSSSALSVLGIVAIGDSGVNEAAKDGGITKVSHVDVKSFSILGLFTKITTTVYGN